MEKTSSILQKSSDLFEEVVSNIKLFEYNDLKNNTILRVVSSYLNEKATLENLITRILIFTALAIFVNFN